MSDKLRFNTGKAPHLHFTDCAGDVTVRGWQEAETLIKGNQVDVTEKEGGLTIHSQGYIKVYVPTESELAFQQVHGGLTVKEVNTDVKLVEGNGDVVVKQARSIECGRVHGSMRLRQIDGMVRLGDVHGAVSAHKVGSISAEQVDGELIGKYVEGDIQVESTNGELRGIYVDGGVKAAAVNGDVRLKYIQGPVSLDAVEGDISLVGHLPPGKHHLNGSGDVIVRWPVDQPVRFLIKADGSIRNRLDLTLEEAGPDRLVGQMGDEGAIVMIEAGGDVILKPMQSIDERYEDDQIFVDIDLELEGIGEQISSKMDELNQYLQTRFGADFQANIARKTEVAIEKAFQGLEAAQASLRSRMVPTPVTPPSAPPPPRSKGAPVAEAPTHESERLKILKMLEQGAITVEDAKTLLEALD